MEYFNSDGLKLAYRVEGEGDPIVLVHGFASTHRANWIETGWSRALTDAGFRVILPDMRGHGASEACYHADDYALGTMADDPAGIANKEALGFRLFAERMGQDLLALAACFEAIRQPFPVAGLGGIVRPVLVVAGEADEQAGAPGPLAALIPGARAVTVPKRDHMKTVGDPAYKEAVLKFLEG